VLYDDQRLELIITYFEVLPSGRQPITQAVLIGSQTGGSGNAGYDGGTETLKGKLATYQFHPTGLTARAIR
jgi:hypothetical protein